MDIAIHHTGHEFDRVIGLQPRCLIADHGVCGSVGFVESVVGKFVEEVPDLGRLFLVDTVFRGSLQELGPLRVHRFLNFLTHCTTQQVSTAQ